MKIGKNLSKMLLVTAGTLIFAFNSQDAFSQQSLRKYEDSLALWRVGKINFNKAFNEAKEISKQWDKPLKQNESFPGQNTAYVFKDYVGCLDLHHHKNGAFSTGGEVDFGDYAVNGIEPIKVYHLDFSNFISNKRTHKYFPIYKKPTNFPQHTKGELITPAPGLPNIFIVSVFDGKNYKPTWYENPNGERKPYGSALSTCGRKEHYVKTEFNRDWQYGLEEKNDSVVLNKN